MTITIGYWDIRGLCQPIRMVLEYAGADWKEVQESCEGPPNYSKAEWLAKKFTLGLDFPNLPYMIDGDIKITQTNAILRYLGRKYQLEGKTEAEKASCDMMLENAMDFRNGFVRLSYSSKEQFDETKPTYLKNLEPKLEQFSKYLGERPFFAANTVTVSDFHMYEMLVSHQKLSPELIGKFPNLVEFIKRMENLPRMADFLKSDRSPVPMNNKFAAFL